MVVNYVDMDTVSGAVVVGATDTARWAEQTEENVQTAVYVTLETTSPETIRLCCPVGDPHRGDALRAIPALLNIAHCLKNGTMQPVDAFGLLVG